LFAFEPSSLRARRDGSVPIPEHQDEFRLSGRWLADRIREAGFEIEEVRFRRIAVKALRMLRRSPSLRAFHFGDALDRVLCLALGVERLGETVMIRARASLPGDQ
jgi:hypothetical protein